ncbi:MAG: hypothetical protein ACLP9S_00830 [Syntrophales bacterium]|jgi:hypothetical protein
MKFMVIRAYNGVTLMAEVYPIGIKNRLVGIHDPQISEKKGISFR